MQLTIQAKLQRRYVRQYRTPFQRLKEYTWYAAVADIYAWHIDIKTVLPTHMMALAFHLIERITTAVVIAAILTHSSSI